jgi:hypothetical protein
VSAIIPIRFPLLEQPQIKLVNQGCGLKCMIAMLAAEIGGGYVVQMGINVRHKLIARLRIPGLPLAEQNRDIPGFALHYSEKPIQNTRYVIAG